MFDFFNSIIGYIESIFNFFVSVITSFIEALLFLAKSMQFGVSVVTYMPSIIYASALAVVGIFVVKFIIGR